MNEGGKVHTPTTPTKSYFPGAKIVISGALHRFKVENEHFRLNVNVTKKNRKTKSALGSVTMENMLNKCDYVIDIAFDYKHKVEKFQALCD